MRTAAATLILALLAGPVPSLPAQEGAGHEELVKESVALLERMSKALAGVQDRATAEAARPELRKAADDFLALRKKAEGLPPPPRAERDRLAKMYRAALVDAERKLRGEMARLETIPGSRAAVLEIAGVLKPPAP